jgi:DNA gyrase subunit A
MGRATQGVRLITLKGNDEIASVAKVDHDEDEELDNAVVAEAEADKAIADSADADIEAGTENVQPIHPDTEIDKGEEAGEDPDDDDKTE